MNYPLISEYVEAIKMAEDNFEELSYLRPVLDDTGQPVMSSGNFAVVFKMWDERNGKLYAVRCFHRDQEGREESYRLIEKELKDVDSPYLVSFRYIDKELFVDSSQTDETEFPVLLMDWVEGITLDKYLRENLDDQYALKMLAYRFSQLAQWLIPQPFAHGDLKPDNILVREDGSLALIDYDGMYVPAMKGQKARELGSPDFRHPLRTEDDFDEHIDDFPLVSILLSLKAISINPDLLEKYGATDRLLLSEKDYRNLSESIALDALKSLAQDTEVTTLLSLFILSISQRTLSSVSSHLLSLSKTSKDSDFNWLTLQGGITEDTAKLAFKTYESRALQGDSHAQYQVALCYIHNWGIRQNLNMAVRWFRKAAEQGHVLAQNNLGVCYLYGWGVPFDEEEVVKWCRKSAEQGNVLAQYNLGVCYCYGCGVPENYEESVKWLRLAADQGNEKAIRCFDELKKNEPSQELIKMDHLYCALDGLAKTVESSQGGCSMSLILEPNMPVEDFLESYSTIVTYEDVENAMEDEFGVIYSRNGKRLLKCKDENITNYRIKSGTMVICDEAFQDCSSLQSIHIPDSVVNIGSHAFSFCKSLQSIHISDGIIIIGAYAFEHCNSIQSVHLPGNVKSINAWTFLGCESLKSIYIPDGVINIDGYAFYGCESLEFIHIPDSVTTIGEGTFGECPSLKSIHIPDNVTSIGHKAFFECTSLKSIRLPNSIMSIGGEAYEWSRRWRSMVSLGNDTFLKCKSLVSIYIPQGTRDKFEELLWDYKDKLIEQDEEQNHSTEVTDEDLANAWVDEYGIKYSANGKKCLKATDPKLNCIIRDGVKVICDKAFSDCRGLASVNIPNSVTSIGKIAFAKCHGLTSVNIPGSVTSIGAGAFSGCGGLISLVVEKGNCTYDSRGDCNAIIETITNTLIAGCVNTIIPDSVTSIGAGAFSWRVGLTSVNIPDSVTSIGEWAFRGCRGLTSVNIPGSVTSIGKGALYGCLGLTSVNIPNSVTFIGESAFQNCSRLTSVNIPDSVTSIGKSAFIGCGSLTSLVIEKGNCTYDSRGDCNAIIETATNTLIAGCVNTVIPDSVTSIGKRAFEGCSGLISMNIPGSVTSIGDGAFWRCSGLTSVNIPDGVTSIGNSAFSRCDSLTSVNIPDSVTSIGDGAFYGCDSLTAIIIPKGRRGLFKNLDLSDDVMLKEV